MSVKPALNLNYIKRINSTIFMTPGIGLMDRRLKTEKDAISLATSGILKKYEVEAVQIDTLETKYDDDAGDWYVALGWNDKKVIIKMDSVQAKISDIKEI